MEKKICEICQKEFETEDLEQILCDECKMNAQQEVVEEDVNQAEEVSAEEAEVEEAVSEEALEASEDSEEAETEEGETEEGGELSEEVLSEEELALLEEEKLQAELKKKKTIKIVSIACGIAALIAIVLFVPFKKDTVADKRVNIFSSLQSAITFNNEQETAMIVNGEKINKGLYNYFFERAQYQLLVETGMDIQNTEPSEINSFWDKEIDGKLAKELVVENTKRDVIQFVLAAQRAKEQGFNVSDEEKESMDQYIASYLTDEVLEQMKLTKEQVLYILEGSALTSKLAEKALAEDKNYEISDEAAENSIKTKGATISAKHILFNTIDPTTYQPFAEDKLAEITKKAEETLVKIEAGEDFDALMNELSEDPGLQQYPNGYTFVKGEMVAPFEEAAFALKENEVSGLVTTDFGIHIIKRIPLTLSETDLKKEKNAMQGEIFEKDILSGAKRVKIMYNDALISTMEVIKY